MSVRRFEGWEPRTRTRVTARDGTGHPSEWITESEVEWTGPQRALMLALHLYEGQLCRKCHEHLSLSSDPDTDPTNPEASRAWVADLPTECFSCQVLAKSEAKYADKDETGSAAWLIHTTQLVPKHPPAHPPR